MPRVRIRDIAQEAGVSQATVSRYLNGHYEAMSVATRDRVAAVIERTGYRPSSVARGLRLDRSGTIGLVLADIQNPYSGAMLAALDARAAAHGLSLMTAVSENDPAREAEAVARLADAQVEGLIINTCGGNDELIARTARALPTVLLDRPVPGAEIDLVTSNNAALVQGLVDEVARGGGRACLMITERGDESPIRRERARVFAEELARRAMPGAVRSLPASANDAGEALRDAVAELAARADASNAMTGTRGRAPVGVIAVNGLVFLDVIEALGAREEATRNAAEASAEEHQADDGRPPVLLATFDDYAWNRVLMGGITTAVQDTDAIADAVLDRLRLRIDAASAPRSAAAARSTGASAQRIEIPGSIARRASTAA